MASWEGTGDQLLSPVFMELTVAPGFYKGNKGRGQEVCIELGMVAYTYNPNYSQGGDQED
jgi:hypothetical protein